MLSLRLCRSAAVDLPHRHHRQQLRGRGATDMLYAIHYTLYATPTMLPPLRYMTLYSVSNTPSSATTSWTRYNRRYMLYAIYPLYTIPPLCYPLYTIPPLCYPLYATPISYKTLYSVSHTFSPPHHTTTPPLLPSHPPTLALSYPRSCVPVQKNGRAGT